MKTVSRIYSRLFSDYTGQGLSEYLILLVLIAVLSITAVQTLGKTIKQKIQTARQHLNNDVTFDR